VKKRPFGANRVVQIIDARLLAVRMIYPTKPFHFEGTVHKPSHFPSRDNAYETGCYWQTVYLCGQRLGLRLAPQSGPTEGVELRVFGHTPIEGEDLDTLEKELRWRFDLDADLREFNDRFAADLLLGPAVSRWRGMRVSCAYSLYEFLVVTIVLQNATVRRSVQMLDSLFRRYGTLVRFDGRELYTFWSPEEIVSVSEEELRSLKLGYRAKSIQRLTRCFADGGMDEASLRGRDKELVRSELLKLYGIGPASVGMLLFELFHHYDAFDTISPWEQKIYSRLLFSKEMVPAEQVLRDVKERWGSWRMLASHYIFEDLFWQRHTRHVPWLEALIRL